MTYGRAVGVGCLAIAIGLLPIGVSCWAGGWTRSYTHNPVGFTADKIPNLEGKVAIVTGANSGIGKATALELARKGACVIVAARSVPKGLDAVKDIISEVGADKQVQFLELDLTSFQSIRNFAVQFLAKGLPLHILVLNAGIGCDYQETAEGFEMMIGTNHIGHHLLVKLLEERLISSAPSRVVAVSSLAHAMSYEPEGIRFDQFQSNKGFDYGLAYGQSKLANVLMASALAQHWKDKQVYVNSCHPGLVATDILRNYYVSLDQNPLGWVIKALLGAFVRPAMLTPQQGALTQLYLATHPDIEEKNITGKYFEPMCYQKEPGVHARNVTLQRKLWDFTEELTKAAQAPLQPV